MDDWTPERVADRLAEAADVLSRLPEEKVQGFFSTWPEIFHDFGDLVGQKPAPMRPPLPSPAAISRMDEALTWIRFLAPEDGKLVWARADGASWKSICWRFGIARATAHRRWQYGLGVIALRLRGSHVPKKRSRAFVVERASRLSSPNG